jgi:hypothetical protein|tara:strand:- start:1826 stop:2014 length:189 start_codon:yes stop_codon:yes gene_type:complete
MSKQYKAKPGYKDLPEKDNMLGLGCASKHIWLLEGMQINYSGKLPEKLKKCLDEVKPPKGDK